LSHHALVDLEANDDHGGVSTAAAGAYVQLIGAAARNAMSGEIGDGSGVQSIDPTARTLDGKASTTKGWKITEAIDITDDNFDTGGLVVAGAVSVGYSVQAQLGVNGNTLLAKSTTENTEGQPPIQSNGGIHANKSIMTDTFYRCGTGVGITDAGPFILTRSDGTTLNVKLAGGILVPA
jgi:hypothetical protein